MNNDRSLWTKNYRLFLYPFGDNLHKKAGVGLRFVREVEQGKLSLRMDKVDQLLWLFGHHMAPVPSPRPGHTPDSEGG